MPAFHFLRPIPGWPGYYLSHHGDVFSRWSNRSPDPHGAPKRLRPQDGKDGYIVYSLRYAPGKYTSVGLHRLLLLVHRGPPPTSLHQACHNDGNHLNNELSNLRWDTPRGNQLDRLKHGTDVRGEKQWMAKLSAADVLSAREKYEAGVPQAALAREYGVSKSQMHRIVHGKTWSHLELGT